MRRHSDAPDPEMQAELDAMEAALAGEPVDPRHANVAELALLVADERPQPRAAFTDELDARVASSPAQSGRSRALRGAASWPWWSALSAGGLLAGAAAALLLVLVLSGGPRVAAPPGARPSSSGAGAPMRRALAAPHVGPASGASGAAGASHAAGTAGASSPLDALTPGNQNLAARVGAPIEPVPNGRKVVRSAELDLATAPNHIDAAAQGVLTVVGSVGGIVDHSSVTQTGGLDGSATFALRIPSVSLTRTLGRLSALDGAQVLSRTDNSEDVNQQYVSASRSLADAQALRTALLKQLASATTAADIASLKAQIHDAETAIAQAQAAINSLSTRITYSSVTVTIIARASATPPVAHGGGFGLGRGVHIAGHVLVVVAGGALIVLAVLLPVALLMALLTWARTGFRRRRREQALDLA